VGADHITFQTVFMGLERAATLRQLQIEQLTEKAAVLRSEKLNIESEQAKAETTTSVDSARASIDQITHQTATERRAINEQVAEIDKELDSQNELTPEAAREAETISTLQQRRDCPGRC
jgi:mannosyltransferase OCH1-like enzyme